ncbi:hypothetical protein K493DRAFT_296308 [Basidiobolus meristosporus CBS 931.73]|uniref:Uncharacterized protein n=1 Tax=Basidiobolus meristosporus CBS 931.73 TaxID=1314790 RepID=A0A1Y1Z6A3_9FUNG|nr:hypothetical protein K493DRAFT_296308 [Basidiobolus meristosporus CBS 931.73]|eukprot:ORY05746.1 hypothetical protein K493DRAFT_296308 [Basidiobolus meristosporus CBS 931.73]
MTPPVLHIPKGTHDNKDLISTISRLINFQGQTVLGWFSRYSKGDFGKLPSSNLSRITSDCFRFFQDLVGLVIYRSDEPQSKKKTPHGELEAYRVSTRAFYSHVVTQDIHSAISEMNSRLHPDPLEESIIRELKTISSRAKPERIPESNIEINDSRFLDHSPLSSGRIGESLKMGAISLDSAQVLPGQGSEFISQSMNADSLHYSTEFDEMAFGMDSICQNSAERLEQLRSRKTMIEGFIDNTCDLVDSYEHSCKEYEMLLHCLQILSQPMDALKRQLRGLEPHASFPSDTNNPSDDDDASSTTSRGQSSNLEHDPESTDTEPERHLMVRLTTAELTTSPKHQQD